MSKIFSGAERAFVKQLSVGKPTGEIVTLNEIEVNLVPLTTRQGKDLVAILGAITTAFKPGAPVDIAAAVDALSQEYERTMKLTRDVLFRSLCASDQIDLEDDGEAVFDDWFFELDLRPTMTALVPAVIRANGLSNILGNRWTPPTERSVESAPAADPEAPATE